ncbi:MAG: hypothetical protein IH830_02290 [Planctomycetes bacterium]|nr:hypothetical protein [Planctomycetota bacterium]
MAYGVLSTDAPLAIARGSVLYFLKNHEHDRQLPHHVAVAAHALDVESGSSIPVYDWPYDPRTSRNFDGTREVSITADISRRTIFIFGWLDDGEHPTGINWQTLFDEAKRVLAEVAASSLDQIPDDLYSVCPGKESPFQHPESGVVFRFRGSCVGFVEHCYETAGADIVNEGSDGRNVPGLSAGDIREVDVVFPNFARRSRHLDNDGYAALLEEEFGHPGLYHILMPGYQLAAFRSCGPYPYSPQKEDAFHVMT